MGDASRDGARDGARGHRIEELAHLAARVGSAFQLVEAQFDTGASGVRAHLPRQPHVDLLGACIDGDGVDPLVLVIEDQTAAVAPQFVDECRDDAADRGWPAGDTPLRDSSTSAHLCDGCREIVEHTLSGRHRGVHHSASAGEVLLIVDASSPGRASSCGSRCVGRSPTACCIPVRAAVESARPDVASFPRTAWAAATRAVLADLPHADLSYGDHRGHQRVREAFASYLARVRGMRATPELMAMTSGFSAGIARAGLHGRVEGVAAGMQAVVRLDDGVNDLELVEDLHDRGVEVVALSRYAIDSPARGLVIGFGQPTVPELRRATAIIADVIAGRG